MSNQGLIGKYAYTAIVKSTGYTIGRADYGTRGYTPFPKAGSFKTWKEAQDAAKAMNETRGMTEREALEIVMDTM